MNIELGNLKEGMYRELTDEELDTLYDMIQDSYSAPKIPGDRNGGYHGA